MYMQKLQENAELHRGRFKISNYQLAIILGFVNIPYEVTSFNQPIFFCNSDVLRKD